MVLWGNCIKDSNKLKILGIVQDCQSSKDCQSYLSPSQAFSNLFSTYTKAINKAYQRTGSLFQKPFRRVLVTSDEHLFHLVTYIQLNPDKHGFIQDFREWPYSSYSTICSTNPTRLHPKSPSWPGPLQRETV